MPNFWPFLGKKSKEKEVQCGSQQERHGKGNVPSDEAATFNERIDAVGPEVLFDDCDEPKSGIDILFVHGLRGHRVHTWTFSNAEGSQRIFWPKDLLQNDLHHVRVITWGYDAEIANFFSHTSQETVFGHATTLLNDLAREGIGGTRPILFICHSLGGLILKEALITSNQYHSNGRFPELGSIYASTAGVIFMGTPHRGSSKAEWAEVAKNLARIAFRQPNGQVLRELTRNSGKLEQQRDSFTTLSKDIPVVCIREELPTEVGLIVPEASASYEGFNVWRDAIHANHMNMVKFRSSKDEGYKRTLGHIRRICRVKWEKDAQVWRADESRTNEVLKILSFPNMRQKEEKVKDPYNETCSWILESPSMKGKAPEKYSQFPLWLQNDEPFFWIRGKAGCGKSTLMKYARYAEKTKQFLENSDWAGGNKVILAGYFFSDEGSDQQQSRNGMLRGVLHQVMEVNRWLVLEVFPEHFLDKHGSKCEMDNEFLTWKTLTNAFDTMLHCLCDTKICLFLDGLDEYRIVDNKHKYTDRQLDLIFGDGESDEAWGHNDWIRDGYIEIAEFLSGLRRHKNLKICFSSREMVPFESRFKDLPKVVVHEHTAPSIARYCQGHLAEYSTGPYKIPELIVEITKRSCGVFLWVRLCVEMLASEITDGAHPEELWQMMNGVPRELGGPKGLYMRMMQRISPHYLKESRRIFELVLRVSRTVDRFLLLNNPAFRSIDLVALFLAEEGHLRKESGRHGLRARDDKYEPKTWQELQPRWEALQRRLKTRCGGLLEGSKKVQFIHLTARQFLTRKYIWNELFHGSTGFATQTEKDLALLSGLVRRFKLCQEAILFIEKSSLRSLKDQKSRYYKGNVVSLRGAFVLFTAIETAREMSGLDLLSDSTHHYVELLDELDRIGERHTYAVRKQFRGQWHWSELYWQDDVKRTPLIDFMGMAVIFGLYAYVQAKMKEETPPRNRLNRLFTISEESLMGNAIDFSAYRQLEMVFDLSEVDGDFVFIVNADGIFFIIDQHLDSKVDESRIQDWKRRVGLAKLFLKHGADAAQSKLEACRRGYVQERPEAVMKEWRLSGAVHPFERLDELVDLIRRMKLAKGEELRQLRDSIQIGF